MEVWPPEFWLQDLDSKVSRAAELKSHGSERRRKGVSKLREKKSILNCESVDITVTLLTLLCVDCSTFF